jgi:hypothetical protein
MFVVSKSTTLAEEKNGIILERRRGGREILVQWANGRQKWCDSNDLVGRQDFDTNLRKGDYS